MKVLWKMLWDKASGMSEHGMLMEPNLEGRVRVTPCLSHCSSAVKRQHDQDNSYKRKYLTGGGGLAYSFRRLVHYHHGRK